MSTIIGSRTYADYPGYIFAAFIAQGGLMGFIKKRSIASLVAGIISALFLAYGAYLNTQNPNDVRVSLATTMLLTIVMGRRFARSGKMMPAGMVAVTSLIMAFRYGRRLM